MTRALGSVEAFDDEAALSRAAAGRFVRAAESAVRESGRFMAALSGGRTPRATYELLASGGAGWIEWERVHLFWGDERYVHQDDPLSNYRMVREALLEAVPIPAPNVHPMPTDAANPDEAARRYEATLRNGFPDAWPRFDLLLLGLGTDGHIASLFPHSPALHERSRWVLATRAPSEPSRRLSITLPVIDHARRVLVLASGAEKQPVIESLFGPDARRDDDALPASLLHPHGEIEWLVSGAAPPAV